MNICKKIRETMMRHKYETPEEFFTQLKKRLSYNPQISKNIKAIFQFSISGRNGGQWYLKLDNGSVDIGTGLIERWECMVKTNPNVFLGIVSGNISPVMAFLSGSVKVFGNRNKLKYLQYIL